MKKLFLTLILISSIYVGFSQVKPVEINHKSHFEALEDAAGSFSKKDIFEIGKLGSLTIQSVKLKELPDGKTTNAVRISGTLYDVAGEKVAVLDADEIDGYLKVLNYINNEVISSPSPANDVEYNYYSRGGFSSGAFNDSKKSKWTVYLQLEKYVRSTFVVKLDDVSKLIALISEAKAKF